MTLFKNYRVYILTTVAYLGSLLFGGCFHSQAKMMADTSYLEKQ